MAAIDYLTLRSTLIYTSPGNLAPIGSVYTVNTARFQTTASTMIIQSTGNVGIGATNPLGPLQIAGTSNTNQSTAPDGGYYHPIVITSPKTGSTVYSMALGVDYTSGCGYINGAGNGAYQPVCIQTRGGNVGIGMTNPAGLFSVLVDGNGTYTPSTWSASYALFGTGVGSTTGSGVGITYNTGGNYGTLIALTPGTSYRAMAYNAVQHTFYISGTQAGYVNSSGFNNGSDEREKINIKSINTEKSLQRILSCSPKTFQRVMDRTDPMILDEVKNRWHIGLIAQEVLSINPHCISEWTNQDGEIRYGINYTDFVTHLIGSVHEIVKQSTIQSTLVQELSKQITSQAETIQSQDATIATLSSSYDRLMAWAQTQGFSG